jgi:uncharacterized protein (DUF2252 family)
MGARKLKVETGASATSAPDPVPDVVPSEDPVSRARGGTDARRRVPRSSQGAWRPAADRPDPVGILEAQDKTRDPDLVPIRHGRMAASPFAFYRGGAAIMAADLAASPNSGLEVQLCGDAHLANFGGYASPERDLVFDLNDFDETLPGPFEWDVKRLVASFEVAARSRGFDGAQCQRVLALAVRTYRQTLRELAAEGNLDIWYSKLDLAEMSARWGGDAGKAQLRAMRRTVDKAEAKNNLKAFSKLTTVVDGQLQIVNDPPLVVRMVDLFGGAMSPEAMQLFLTNAIERYRGTLAPERRLLFDRYRYVDGARKVVGVGSVGTRCWIALFLGRDEGDPLFLQIKEAQASVLEQFAGASQYDQHGERVVVGQRLVQAASDIMLGWFRTAGADGVVRDFYIRQLWDAKASADLETMTHNGMCIYAQMCGWVLARAHARSGDPIAMGAYLGSGDGFDRAMGAFARAYADQNEIDHSDFVAAIDAGRIPAQYGV